MKQIILIDGKNYCWRHGWTRRALHTSKKFPTGVIYGVLAGLIRLNRLFPEAAFVFCWDGEESNTKSWRHKYDKVYKANRRGKKEKDIPQEVKEVHIQIPVLKEILKVMGFVQFEVKRLEADDLIGVLATELAKKKLKVSIYSSDKDFFQLIGGRISLIRDIDKSLNCRPITTEQIKEEFGVDCIDWLKFRAFVGDPSDNIKKPVRGCGKVGTLKLLAAGANPAKVECTIEKLKPNWEAIRRNYKLLKIVKSVDDTRLLHKTSIKLAKLVSSMLSSGIPASLFRQKKTKKAYTSMLQYFAKYQLEYLLEVRDKLWKIP